LFDANTREKWRSKILESSLVFVDIDPHEGRREYELLSWLRSSGYQGLVVLDDIWHFKGMRENLWYKLEPRFKADATRIGHWSGTGFVSFGQEGPPEGDGIVPRSEVENWTLVTGYFDLTKKPDANKEIQSRPAAHYLDEHAASTLALDKNLVVFCEPDCRERILGKRPKWLHERTHVVTMAFEDFPLSRSLSKIIESRRGSHCARDPRNTASYYLFCMARFAMLKRAIAENPFGSTHFAWINICIERMGFSNMVHLDEALAEQREKFSTCYIDYVSRSTLASLSAFFGPDGCRDPNGTCGRCSMCSGFFTGGAEHMRSVCDLVENKFVACLEAGYGHADEQLLALVHAERPDLFEWYCGDYHQMITNYRAVHERPESPIHNLIRHSLEAGDWETCLRAADIVWSSYVGGKCELSDVDLSFLLAAKKTSEIGLAGRA
jgi:hypothetical protein